MTEAAQAVNKKAVGGIPYRLPKEVRIVPPCPPERYAEIGMVVQHYPDAAANAIPTCAIVTRVGMDTIDCNIIHPAVGTLMPFSGVHHMDFQKERIDSEGAWRPLPLQVAMLRSMIDTDSLVWDGESKYIEPDRKPETIPKAEKPAGAGAGALSAVV